MTQLELFKPSPIAWKPHSGQKLGMKFLLEHACAGLAADPGVGKTSITYGAFKVLRKKKLADKMLVIAPLKPCYLVWPKEQEKWLDFGEFKVEVLHGKNRTEEAIERADICVINPDGLDWLLEAKRVKNARGRVSVTTNLARFKKFGFDTLVVDELTRFKHTSSGRFKVLKTALHLFSRRWGLTGSLVANGLMDLFGQCQVLDLGNALGAYITHYRNSYFVPSHSGFGWDLQEGAEARIFEKIAPMFLRLNAEDYVDMPMVVDVPHVFQLPPKVRELYDQLEDDMIAQMDGNTFIAKNAGVASIKCRQVAAGGLYLDQEVKALLNGGFAKSSKREWVNLHTEKIDLLDSLVEELQGSPLLVAYDFEHDLDRLGDWFKGRYGKDQELPYIGGGVTPKRFKELELAWNRGDLPILAGHPASVAHGLNLQESGSHIAWHSYTWDYELYDQFIRRLRRQGSKNKRIFNHLFIAENTTDELMVWAMRRKAKGQQTAYDALSELRKMRRSRK